MRLLSCLIAVLVCCGCGPSPAGARDEGQKATASRGEPGWTEHARNGLSLQAPKGWSAEPDPQGGWLTLSDAEGDNEALVWPVFLPPQDRSRAFAPLARTLLERAWSETDWQAAREQVSGNRVVLRVAEEDETATAIFAWSETPKGTAGVLYAIRCDPEMCAVFAPVASRVFATLRLTGNGGAATSAPQPAAATTASPRVRFTDPRERAFSVEVPQGWAVEGGLFRFGAVDVRLAVETRSPDGAIVVRLGDPSIGPFVTGAIGFAEGSTFSPGYGQTMTVRTYRPPATFAAQYASQQQACRGFTPGQLQARPDLVTQMNGLYQRYGLTMRLDAGEASFTCGGENGLRGYWLAVLQIVQMGGPAMWKPEYLLGYLAPASREAEARQVMADLIGTVQVDPGWYQRQTGQAGQVSQVVSQTGEAIAKTVNGGYWDRTRNQRAMSIADSNARLGIEQYENPATGQRYDVAAGWNHQWVSPQGTVVGTQTDAVPHVDFSALTFVPPGR